jgi:putative SOS response-associated peptidase YedK
MIAIGKAGDRRIVSARWGLRPAWMTKDMPSGPLFNARSETIDQKASFKAAFARKRCLIPADGFYEWQRDGTAKIPYFVARPDRAAVAFAGLWESAPDGAGATMVSMSIITAAAPPSFAAIHDRFPVVLDQDNWQKWLDPASSAPTLKPLLNAPSDGFMVPFRVSDHVNKVANDDATCFAPLETD